MTPTSDVAGDTAEPAGRPTGAAARPAGPTESELLAAAYLSRVAEPAAIPLWLLVQEYGYPDAAAAIRAGDVPPEVTACTEARRSSADPHADLAAAERNDIRLITPSSAEWPHYAFAAMHRLARRRTAEWLTGRRTRAPRGELIPPLALWIRGRGELAAVGVRSVALVGSRAATPYGDQLAADFGYGLARHEVVVVSGGAYGIDAAAHRGVLAADGESVLVSAAGLDRPYPPGHRNLYDRTAEQGVLVSELPPGSAPHRQRFLSRNRIIAALGAVTVVVEAGQRSGALNTAGYARDLGRPVLAVPGPVTSAMSVGCHRLLQRDEQPAHLVTSLADILGFCSITGTGHGPAAADAAAGKPTMVGDGAAGDVVISGSASGGAVTRDGGAVGDDGSAGGHTAIGAGLGAGCGPGSDFGSTGGSGPGSLPGLGDGSGAGCGPRSAVAGDDGLDLAAQRVLDGFPARGPVTEAQLARLSGQPVPVVLAALPLLLARGLIAGSREGYRLVHRSGARSGSGRSRPS